MASQKGLGKGLGALLGDFTEEVPEKSAYRLLPIYKVEPNPDQPRQDFDEEELQSAVWVSREELEEVRENLLSLTGTMIETFRRGRI